MENTFSQQKNGLLLDLAAFYTVSVKHKNNRGAEKIKNLAQKLEDEELVVAFCGHFSAGKSAMINALMGENLLPSSPIPTSANLVAIHAGEDKNIRITMSDDKRIELLPPLNVSVVNQLGKNGAKVKRIDIYRSDSLLPSGVTVMDTPGIDSVDDAHKQSTESAIHSADLLFYVMDYNHVQSQMNFEWIRHMRKHHRPVHAIINQIDKHKDDELSFPVFKQSTEQAFAAWEASPLSTYYTTLKKPDHPFNDLQKIKAFVEGMMDNREETILETAKTSLEIIKEEHRNYLEEELEEMIDTYEDLLTQEELTNPDQVFMQEKELEEENAVYSLDQWESSFDHKRDEILRAAYLMPAEIREKAKLFLEANDPSYKVGVFFSAKKTEAERSARTDDFIRSLEEIVKQQLLWQIKNGCYTALKEAGASGASWSEEIESLTIPVDRQLAVSHIKPGAEVNGQSVLNYCEDLAKTLRFSAKRLMDGMKEKLIEEIQNEIEEYTHHAQSKWNSLHQKANALRSIKQVEHQLEELTKPLQDDGAKALQSWEEEWAASEKTIKKINEIDSLTEAKGESEKIPEKSSSIEQVNPEKIREKEVIHNLEVAVEELESVEGFARQREYLLQRINKLQSKNFTIALFGAFSAGKSSFANALLGKKVLPVSPNPTTASINRIKPPTGEDQDGTVRVYFKSRENLLSDLTHIFKELDFHPSSLEEAYELVDQAAAVTRSGMEAKKSFLHAFKKGWSNYSSHLGEELTVDEAEFEGFVAKEEQSCFVEAIDYFLSSRLAELGVSIVDTPGADSINARHTDVSFDYIRSADAVLFLTYYNHAFARADREFLIQLGRVKDSFEMDKMFFVVNAVDLAHDEEEKRQVLTYVKEQLVIFGIRSPRLFGVSSLQALSQDPNDIKASGIRPFERSFHQFLKDDLQGMALRTAHFEYAAAVKRIETLIKTASQNEEVKEQTKVKLAKARNYLSAHFANPSFTTVEARIEQEMKELMIYMEQRVFYRFSDFFKESFHPSLFTDQTSGKALKEALSNLLTMLGFDFAQELRVVNHRLIQHIEKQLTEQLKSEWHSLESLIPDGLMPPIKLPNLDILSFSPWFENESASDYKKELSLFKNTRSFFEKNEKRFMRDALQERLKIQAQTFLSEEQKRLKDWMILMLSTEGKELYTRWMEDLIEQIDSQMVSFSSHEVVEHWQKAYEAIEQRSAL
ncbi:dynamin family protein [Jeotgalibacillus proteolyticus]|uniref:Dynamin N-terminal domain-containing protein n=1 Tax=Jeotgalibacillus proteolyticus TaxID=2082395 RepID=A0A2S5GDX9_9BACL|nr:dynamin family protein [Jeotgalibacillus proteolyticus]PPA71220.1 hypothetical protein C4B60_03900 [Jeotgalibacillus proteolyticus]